MPDHVTGHNFVTRHGYVIQNYSTTERETENEVPLPLRSEVKKSAVFLFIF